MKNLGTKTLETKRLILRKPTEKDCEFMFINWSSDPRVTKYLTWEAHKSLDELRNGYFQYILDVADNPVTYHWFIESKELKMPIGAIDVIQLDERTEIASIGYCLGYDYWHQGIMTEAFRTVIKFLFDEVGVNRIESFHDLRNPHSGDVMKKCGLQYEGTLRQHGKNQQGICDEAWYALLKQDYLKLKD